MKLLRLVLLGVLLVTSTPVVFAEEKQNDCYDVKYYSRKEWVPYFDFFDVDFENATQMTNSKLISANFNAWGPYSFTEAGAGIYPLSHKHLMGQPLEVVANNEHEDFYSTFAVTFGNTIRVHELEFEVSIKDKNGHPVEHVVYIEGKNGKEIIYEGNDPSRTRLDLKGQEVRAFYIRAKRPENGNVHRLSYFRIHTYEVYEHAKWVKEEIPDTETFVQRYCEASGTFFPNEGKTWKKHYRSIFTPSVKAINDAVKYERIDSWSRYNDGLRIGIESGSTPDYRSMYLWDGADRKLTKTFGWLPDDKPFYWRKDKNHFSGVDRESGSEYILTDKTQNNRKVYVTVSADAIRCEGNCNWGSGKKDGHGSNRNNNAYDSYVNTYTGGAIDEMSYVSSITFYLCDAQGRRVKELKTVTGDFVNDLEKVASELEIVDSGIWKIEARMKNPLGDSVSRFSELFHVDNVTPVVLFSPEQEEGSNEVISVTVRVSDVASGVLKWRYSLLKDGEASGDYSAWFQDEKKVIEILDTGETVIKVEAIDQAGNTSVTHSGVYRIFANPPTLILKSNYYYTHEKVDESRLKENALAFDEVDGDISTNVEIHKIEYADGSIEEHPTFLDTSVAQTVKIYYRIQNTKGKEVIDFKEYQIVDNGSDYLVSEEELEIYARYINPHYQNTLDEDSIWIRNQEYSRILESALQNPVVEDSILIGDRSGKPVERR